MSNEMRVPRGETQEIKIELNTLYSLHNACVKLEHAARESKHPSPEWELFPPSRFIYAYFTFNSIYSLNWEKSLKEKRATKWYRGELYESEQFEKLVNFYYSTLNAKTARILQKSLQENLLFLGIQDAEEQLKKISAKNETKKTKHLRENFPSNFKALIQQPVSLDGHKDILFGVLSFIYAVRNNIFHGSKSKIQMDNAEQQIRLSIYTAILIATNSLLFEAVETTSIGWKRVPVSFETTMQVQVRT